MSARAVHLVGSIPLADAQAVFRAVAMELGDRVRRIPDGETGERSDWTAWQWHAFAASPLLERAGPAADRDPASAQFRLRTGARGAELRFGDLGYAAAAATSFERFSELKAAGVIAKPVRFQVSLPTPIAVLNRFVVPEDRAAIEPAYETALLADVRRMADTIPPAELALQWDVAVELAMWERANGRGEFRYLDGEAWFDDVREGILARLTRLCESVPAGVELGIHLCYGNRGGRHFVEPLDSGALVEIANALFDRVRRPIGWLHLPVPVERTDESYFAPLRDLRLPLETELYLGLVHQQDGIEGARRRIAAAGTAHAFGIATECGFGRLPAGAVPQLLALHRAIA